MEYVSITITRQNINKLCRLCLQENNSLKSINSVLKISENLSFANILQASFPDIDANPSYPKFICEICENLVQNLYVLQLNIRNSKQILDDFLEKCKPKNVKTIEIPEVGPLEEIILKYEDISSIDTASVEENVQESNPTEKRHMCPICFEKLNILEFRSHIKTHKTLKKYLNIPKQLKVSKKARFFTWQRKNKSSLWRHPSPLYDCIYCEVKLKNTELREHFREHCRKDELKCAKCDRTFRNMKNLNNHVIIHKKEHPYTCKVCKKGFVIKSNYDFHVLEHATDANAIIMCEFCGRQFTNPRYLQRHIAYHNSSNKKNFYKCYRCKEEFAKNELLEHTKDCTASIHASKNGYKCKFCGQHVNNWNALLSHLEKIHQKGSKLCSKCGKTTENLSAHNFKYHSIKKFKCNFCVMKFVSRQKLQLHETVHTGLKEHICRFCGKAFSNPTNMKAHERIHGNRSRHKCKLCDKSFLEASYLKRHVKKDHSVP